jgi:hypothetical protein
MTEASKNPLGDTATAMFAQKIQTELRHNFNNSLLLMTARYLAKHDPAFALEFQDLLTKWHARQIEQAQDHYTRLEQLAKSEEATPGVVESALRKQRLVTETLLPDMVNQLRTLVLNQSPPPTSPPTAAPAAATMARPPAKPR